MPISPQTMFQNNTPSLEEKHAYPHGHLHVWNRLRSSRYPYYHLNWSRKKKKKKKKKEWMKRLASFLLCRKNLTRSVACFVLELAYDWPSAFLRLFCLLASLCICRHSLSRYVFLTSWQQPRLCALHVLGPVNGSPPR